MTKRVLIVEDEIFVALEIEHIVTSAGLNVSGIAADSASALAAARDSDIALVDLNLRDGPTGPHIGRTLAERYGVMVIFVTANPSQIEVAPAAALGVITKPFHASAIRAALQFAMSGAGQSFDAIDGFRPFRLPSGSWPVSEYAN